MEDKEKQSLFKKIGSKWAEIRGNVSNKMHSAKETIKEKFTKTKTKIVVSVGGIVLAGAIALTSMVSCGKNDFNNNDLNDNNNNDIQYETTIDGEIIEVITPGDNENPGVENPDNGGSIQNNNQNNQQGNKEDIRKSLESYLINNNEYNIAIEKAKNNFEFSNSAAFDPHPYAYLEQKGHDVEGIKNGIIECDSISYVLNEDPNTLYIATKVYENRVATHYHLAYELNDETMEIVKLANEGTYLQAAFVNDAVSELYKPKMETCLKMPESTSKNINEDYKDYLDDGNDVFTIIKDLNLEDNTFTCILIPKFPNREEKACRSSEIATINAKSRYTIEVIENDVYSMPTSGRHIINSTFTENRASLYNTQDLNWHYTIPEFESHFNK